MNSFINNKRVAIMQPSLIPWGGFFSLGFHINSLVIFDSVEYSKGGSHNRVFLSNTNGDKQTLSIPVFYKANSKAQIKDIEIRSDMFPSKFVRTLEFIYPSSKRKNTLILSNLINIIQETNFNLSELNTSIIKYIYSLLDLKINFYKSSKILIPSLENMGRTERLFAILNYLQCKNYITPYQSVPYLLEDKHIFRDNSIKVESLKYEQIEYQQFHKKKFIPNLSILDMFMTMEIDQVKNIILKSTSINPVSFQ